MSNHVTEWLNAYFDGELTGKQLIRVEEHLATCETCQVEFESLGKLSSLLQEVPTPEFTPPERFAAHVSLRVPHQQVVVSKKQLIDVGWWLIPVGLVASWVFLSTAFAMGDILSTVNSLGMLSGLSEWLGPGSNNIYLSTTIGQMGLLNGNGLDWAEAVETLTRASWPQILLQISIALVYLSWLAIWWTRQQSQEHGQLLES